MAVRDDGRRDRRRGVDANRDELFCATRGGPATAARVRAGASSCSARGRHDSSQQRHTGGGAGPGAQAGPGGEDLASAMVATGLAYDADVRQAQAEVLERLAPRVRDIRRMGSAALDLAWTAAGRFDAYYERSVKQWDIAAGALVCESAGLHVHELSELHESLPWGILVAPPGFATAAGARRRTIEART